MLKMEGVCKSFPGVRALDGAHLEVRRGSVHALMGENGAGKSTLMKCLFGIYKKDAGRIMLDGAEVELQNAKDALEHGVAMVHQELNQALKLSVMDNVFLGRVPKITPYLPFTSERRLYRETKKIFDELGLDIDPRARMEDLPVSKRQMIEIAKAVSYRARVIVFDEPTSSLTEPEAEQLFSIIEHLKQNGCGIIYISHKMDEILRISDEVTVMRDGRHIATRESGELTMDEIIRLMVGRTLRDRYPEKINRPGAPLFEVRGLSSTESRLRGIEFSLKEGEILGIAGLDGAGRTEILESIFGLRRIDSGELVLKGKSIRNRTVREAIGNGFAMVSEERRANGIFPILSILENTVISSLKRFNTGPILSSKAMKKATLDSIARLGVRTPNEQTKIETLSGGNQQKVIIGRWLLTEPTVMMLDEPTRGIDVGAKYEIYKLIIELASGGKGIIMVSSEMAELLGICDRIVVISGGRVAGVLGRDEATQEKIMALAAKFA